MRAADPATIPWTTVSGHRSGRIEFKRLLAGEQGAPDNFELSLVRTFADYATPRHRHNFDQIRYGLAGAMNYAPRHDVVAGSVAYFPEGAFYGPQRTAGESLILLLQLGGASGQGFMSYEELQAGHDALAARGTFAGGVYRGDAEHTQDGYEAVWEHVHGRPVAYPAPRVGEPVLMWPAHHAWAALPEEPGVEAKLLGVFSERRLELVCVRVAAGAVYEPARRDAARLLFVLAGAVEAAGATLGPHAAVLVPPRERARLTATADAELFAVGLPMFAPSAA